MQSEQAKERWAQRRHYRQLAQEASRPDTPPEKLRRLSEEAKQGSRWEKAQQILVDALVSHPNSPRDVIEQWLYSAPEAFLRNPILPLLPLEYPDLFESQYEETLLQLLSYATVPSPLVRLLVVSSYESVAEAARYHIALTDEAGSEWRAEVQGTLEALPLVRKEEYQALAALGLLPDWLAERVAVALEYPAIPAPVPSWAASSLKPIVFPETLLTAPPGGWATLLNKDVATRIVLAHDATLPPEALKALAGDRVEVRIHVAKNPMATPEVLMRLAGSGHRVDELVAIHPNATLPVLRRLMDAAWSPDIAVRILRRPNLTPSVLALLAEHNNREIRWIVYHHPLSRRDGSLRPAIARRLQGETLKRLWRHAVNRWDEEDDCLLIYIALNLSVTPRWMLTRAANAPYWIRRLAVAQHPKTPPKVRQRLAEQDGNRFVRAAARDALANGVS